MLLPCMIPSSIRNSAPWRAQSRLREFLAWQARDFAGPSPTFIKQRCLARNGFPGGTWVETGTYLGATTRFLARSARMVHSIEPEPSLFAKARRSFEGVENVEVHHGTSEAVFPVLLPRLSGDVSFWLDGHYSEGVTYQGAKDTPIVDELAAIALHRPHLGRIAVLVDDVRMFDPRLDGCQGYPPIDFLVDWARARGLRWHVEHDIFVARS